LPNNKLPSHRIDVSFNDVQTSLNIIIFKDIMLKEIFGNFSFKFYLSVENKRGIIIILNILIGVLYLVEFSTLS